MGERERERERLPRRSSSARFHSRTHSFTHTTAHLAQKVLNPPPCPCRALSRKEREWGALRQEYEQALEELEREMQAEVERARASAGTAASAELEQARARLVLLEGEVQAFRGERDAAVQKRHDDVSKCQTEWAEVYGELEKLYYKAKGDLDIRGDAVRRAEDELSRLRIQVASERTPHSSSRCEPRTLASESGGKRWQQKSNRSPSCCEPRAPAPLDSERLKNVLSLAIML